MWIVARAGQVLLVTVLVSLLSSAVASATGANETWKREHARELDDRFAKTCGGPIQGRGQPLESQIWALWNQSGCDEVDALMWQAHLLCARDSTSRRSN